MKQRSRKLLLSMIGAGTLVLSAVIPAFAATSTSYNLNGKMVYGNLYPSSGGTASSSAQTSFDGTGAVSVSVTYTYRFGSNNYTAYGSNSGVGTQPSTFASAFPNYVPAVSISSSGTHLASDGSGTWNGSTSS